MHEGPSASRELKARSIAFPKRSTPYPPVPDFDTLCRAHLGEVDLAGPTSAQVILGDIRKTSPAFGLPTDFEPAVKYSASRGKTTQPLSQTVADSTGDCRNRRASLPQCMDRGRTGHFGSLRAMGDFQARRVVDRRRARLCRLRERPFLSRNARSDWLTAARHDYPGRRSPSASAARVSDTANSWVPLGTCDQAETRLFEKTVTGPFLPSKKRSGRPPATPRHLREFPASNWIVTRWGRSKHLTSLGISGRGRRFATLLPRLSY